jgi:UDP-N-acetylglucosamine 1-carboxyvinyltransferase
MDEYEIVGGRRLKGTVTISGSKNAALPCLFATLLTDEPCTLKRVPHLADIDTSIGLLRTLGKKVHRVKDTIVITQPGHLSGRAPYDLVRRMRASVLVLGPLLARTGNARVSLPGGCSIGARPVNFHLNGFKKMGAKIRIQKGYVHAHNTVLKGRRIRFPFPSVGGTENLLMGAALAKGQTILSNAAREPEIVDLGRMLQKMGASIRGLGTSTIIVNGVKELAGVNHTVIPDRIEAGTFIMAAAITKGSVILKNCDLGYLEEVVRVLKKSGLSISQNGSGARVKWVKDLKSQNIKTAVYPGFPTDLQAQWMALLSLAKGVSQIKETVFENRFLHVNELVRFGAQIETNGRVARVRGVDHFSGCSVMVSDLRAGAALILAGLVAEGTTSVLRIYHLDRGYENLDKKLRGLGARIKRISR